MPRLSHHCPLPVEDQYKSADSARRDRPARIAFLSYDPLPANPALRHSMKPVIVFERDYQSWRFVCVHRGHLICDGFYCFRFFRIMAGHGTEYGRNSRKQGQRWVRFDRLVCMMAIDTWPVAQWTHISGINIGADSCSPFQ